MLPFLIPLITAAVGAGVGALADKKHRGAGALKGAGIGGMAGLGAMGGGGGLASIAKLAPSVMGAMGGGASPQSQPVPMVPMAGPQQIPTAPLTSGYRFPREQVQMSYNRPTGGYYG